MAYRYAIVGWSMGNSLASATRESGSNPEPTQIILDSKIVL